jgi:hypothetical protein
MERVRAKAAKTAAKAAAKRRQGEVAAGAYTSAPHGTDMGIQLVDPGSEAHSLKKTKH